jgi:hypothetical protein
LRNGERPMQRTFWLYGWIAVLLAAPGLAGPARADGPNQAALVVQFSQDRVESRCIPFEGADITGGELLARSGLDVLIDASWGMGITVCRVEDVGCDYPAEHCFCQCMGGGPCAYWNYFYRDSGGEEWVYSPLGAALHKARPGSVEAWVWGDGHTPPAGDLTFEAICVAPTAVASAPSPQPERQAPASATPNTVKATPQPAATRDSTPVPTASSTPTSLPPTVAATPAPMTYAASGLTSYWAFGLIVLSLAVIGAIVWLRR